MIEEQKIVKKVMKEQAGRKRSTDFGVVGAISGRKAVMWKTARPRGGEGHVLRGSEEPAIRVINQYGTTERQCITMFYVPTIK